MSKYHPLPDIKADYQTIVREGYQDVLEDLGFVSYRGELLQWLYLRGEVLFSLQMQSIGDTGTHMFPMLKMLPLFLKVELPAPLIYTIDYGNCSESIKLYTRWPDFPEHTTVPIACPKGGGAFVREWLEYFLQTVQTPQDAFEIRKTIFASGRTDFISNDSIDEIIYYQDEEYWQRAIRWLELIFSRTPDYQTSENPYVVRRRRQYKALTDPQSREEHLRLLEEFREKQRRMLKKKVPELFGQTTERRI